MYVLRQVEEKLNKAFFTSDEEISELEIIAKLPITQLSLDLGEIRKGLISVEKAK